MRARAAWSDDLLSLIDAISEPEAKLAALTRLCVESQRHLHAVRAERLRVAAQLRQEGMAMSDIARVAGVSDSYLSRKLIEAGLRRRVGRRR